MKKVLVVLAAMMFIMVGSAMASPITMSKEVKFGNAASDFKQTGDSRISATLGNYKSTDGHVHHLRHEGDYVEWSYNINFDPAKDATAAVIDLSIDLHDDGDGWAGKAHAKGGFNGQTWDMGKFEGYKEFNYHFTLVGNVLTVRIENNGTWDWTDGFYLDASQLNVTYNPAPVPEPATMTLLGIGMLGAGMAAKRRNRKVKSAE